MQPLIIAFQLLTRIPIPVAVDHTPYNQGHSMLFYPLVGAVIGAVLMLFGALLETQPAVVQAALLLSIWVGLTGALHLDGLADSADGWVGGMGDRKRILEIMKDPSAGPMGVTAIVLVLLLKWSAVVALIESETLLLLFWSPVLARLLLISLFQTTPYLRAGGMGEDLSRNIPQWKAYAVQLLVFGLALYFGVHWALLLLHISIAFLFRLLVLQQLGGITGDVAGAMVEKMELLFVLLCVLL